MEGCAPVGPESAAIAAVAEASAAGSWASVAQVEPWSPPLEAFCAALLCLAVVLWLGGGTGSGGGRARALFAGGFGGVAGARLPVVGRPWPPFDRRAAGAEALPRLLASGRLPGRLVRWLEAATTGGRGTAARRWWPCLVVAIGILLALWQRSLLPLPVAVGGAVLLDRRLRRQGEARAAQRREEAVVSFCEGVAAELRAGRQPPQALLEAGVEELGPTGAGLSTAARFGGDVPAALRRAARQPGAEGLSGVAACWQVAAEQGAGLAVGLERVATALRLEMAQRDELRAQLAGVRATVQVLALLPVLGLLLGTAMGAAPLEVLLHSSVGWVLMLLAGLLEAAGIAWVDRIVRTAEPSGAEVPE